MFEPQVPLVVAAGFGSAFAFAAFAVGVVVGPKVRAKLEQLKLRAQAKLDEVREDVRERL